MDQNNQQEDGKGSSPRSFMNWRLLLPLLLIFMLVPMALTYFNGNNAGTEISYTRFKQMVQDGSIQQVTIQGDRISGGPYSSSGTGSRSSQMISYVPTFGDDELLPLLSESGVEVITKPADQPGFFSIIISILPYIFLVWIFFLLFRNIRGQGKSIFQVGENKAKLYDEKQEKTTFADVAGLEGPKEEVMEIVDYLKEPSRYTRLGARSPKGILLVGPPGTGKTLIARAIAGEAGVPFFSMSGSDFMEMFVGVGASRVRNLFRDAKKRAPSIIFIDELDSIGRHRGAGVGGGHDEREQTLNQMLSELDGFEQNSGTVVVAATNRPDILDPALLRPGRFDRQIAIPLPTLDEREAILKVHAKGKPFEAAVDIQRIARQTIGFSGADLKNLLNEAALRTARRNANSITPQDVEEARDRILMGIERKSIHMTDKERKVTAYHEAGHAITAVVLPDLDPVTKVSIVPRGRTLGVTVSEPAEERYNESKEYFEQLVCMIHGGRAAEMLVFGSMTSGAADDLKKSTSIARQMVTSWGMGDGLAHIAMGEGDRDVFLGEQIGHQRSYSEETARQIDNEIIGILKKAYERAMAILTEKRSILDRLAELLLDKEQVTGEEVTELLAGAT